MADIRLNVMPFGTQVIFRCPRHPERECGANLKGMPGASQTWENIGTDDKPTLMPSYNCINGCGWHGYIVDGECGILDAKPFGSVKLTVDYANRILAARVRSLRSSDSSRSDTETPNG